MLYKGLDLTKPYTCTSCCISKVPKSNMKCNKCMRHMRRWDTNYRTVTLKEIIWEAKRLKFTPSKELRVGLKYFINRHPELDNIYKDDYVFLAKVLIVATKYAFDGKIEFGLPYLTFLLYLMMTRENQYIYRDKPKERKRLSDNLQAFTYQVDDKCLKLFGILLQENRT